MAVDVSEEEPYLQFIRRSITAFSLRGSTGVEDVLLPHLLPVFGDYITASGSERLRRLASPGTEPTTAASTAPSTTSTFDPGGLLGQ